jgi:hypothetical protein
MGLALIFFERAKYKEPRPRRKPSVAEAPDSFFLEPPRGNLKACCVDWFYVSDGRQLGPVSENRLEELLRSETISRETLVWHKGLKDWLPLHEARSLSPSVVKTARTAQCVECQQLFSEDEMILLDRSWICGRCKPVFLQRLQEGGPPAGQAWRANRQFVARVQTPLPDRCVCCNAPANGYRLKRQLSWHPPVYYALLLAGPLIYIIVALFASRKAVIQVGLCSKHRWRRGWGMLTATIAILAGVALIDAFTASGAQAWVLLILGLLVLGGGIVVGARVDGVVSSARIDNEHIWLRGAKEPFLASLPEWRD